VGFAVCGERAEPVCAGYDRVPNSRRDRKVKTPRLYLCDFGWGIRRYDIGKVSICEELADDGTYRGLGWAVQFDFSLATIRFLHRLSKFMGKKKGDSK